MIFIFKISGSFDYKCNKIFFKIDYYDLNYEFMSKNAVHDHLWKETRH
ncbi:MAG: DUF3768 domain-containing protein [Alphaproteobacteria bacterium]|nr:DUF3768 domain-containing protein [Alphaproteobacteria bacterium]